MTHAGYWAKQSHSHAVFDKSMSSTAGDFRHLTPLVVMAALARAGTEVHEPLHRFRLEVPADALGPVTAVLGRLGATPEAPALERDVCLVDGEIPAARVHELQRELPALTRGEACSRRPSSATAPSAAGRSRRARARSPIRWTARSTSCRSCAASRCRGRRKYGWPH